MQKTTTESQRQELLENEKMNDLALKEHQLILFPKNVGLTGQAYLTQGTFVINNFPYRPAGSDFTSAIDNPKGIQSIKNFMVGALINS